MAMEMNRQRQTEFRQIVYASGYNTIRWNVSRDDHRSLAKGREDDVIVAIDRLSETRSYRPMAIPALYRKFASLDYSNPLELLSFINEHGFLEHEDYYFHAFRSIWYSDESKPSHNWYEPMVDVQKHIYEMQEAVNLMDAIRRNDPYELAYLGSGYEWCLPDEYVTCDLVQVNWRKKLRKCEEIKSTEAAVLLRENCCPLPENVDLLGEMIRQFTYTTHFFLSNSVTAFIDVDYSEKPVLRMQPKNLLGAMYLQLAQDFTGERSYRKCMNCDSWLEIGTGDDANKATRLYCSDSCRMKAYRRRKQANSRS